MDSETVELEVRDIITQDLACAASFWHAYMKKRNREGHPGSILNTDILSLHGVCVEFAESMHPIAYLFLWPTVGSLTCYVGFPISDHTVDKEIRDVALDLAYDEIEHKARAQGFKYIWSMSGLPFVEDRLERHGYIRGDTIVNQYWRIL